MPIVRKKLKESSVKRNLIESENIEPGKFKNDISISNVRELKQQKESSNQGVIFEYTFKTSYALKKPEGKSLGEIKIIGELFYVDDKSVIEGILNEWKENEKLKPDMMKKVLNVAFRDAQIEALSQAEKVGLPTPVPLMRLKDTQ